MLIKKKLSRVQSDLTDALISKSFNYGVGEYG